MINFIEKIPHFTGSNLSTKVSPSRPVERPAPTDANPELTERSVSAAAPPFPAAGDVAVQLSFNGTDFTVAATLRYYVEPSLSAVTPAAPWKGLPDRARGARAECAARLVTLQSTAQRAPPGRSGILHSAPQ